MTARLLFYRGRTVLASIRIASACLAVGYVAAIVAPCPTVALVAAPAAPLHAAHGAHSGHAAHADGDHSVALQARCPCGCDDRSSASSAGPGKLGASLPVALEDRAPTGAAVPVHTASVWTLPRAFPPPEFVPI